VGGVSRRRLLFVFENVIGLGEASHKMFSTERFLFQAERVFRHSFAWAMLFRAR
jgi:hypothetical protein